MLGKEATHILLVIMKACFVSTLRMVHEMHRHSILRLSLERTPLEILSNFAGQWPKLIRQRMWPEIPYWYINPNAGSCLCRRVYDESHTQGFSDTSLEHKITVSRRHAKDFSRDDA
jgi:hypothetical protein